MVADLVVKAVKPSEERTSGNSDRRLEMHSGVERLFAWRLEDKDRAADARLNFGEPG